MSADTPFIRKNRPTTKTVEAAYTRPADTTTYAAGDVIANSTSAASVMTFASVARGAGLGGVIQNAVLIMSTAASLKLMADLFLFDTAPAMQNDNAAFACTDSELDKAVGHIVFDGLGYAKTTANGLLIPANGLSLAFQCASGVTALYGVLVARNAYIPGSAETLRVRLAVIQD